MDDSHDIKKGLTFPASPTKTHSSASSDEAMSPATTNDAAGADSGARTNRRFLIISAAVLALLIAVAVGLGVALGGTSASSDEKSFSSEAQQQEQAGDNGDNGDNTSTQTATATATTTSNPTVVPSSQPSLAPTTLSPTVTPSGRPSLRPSGAPSERPSLRPSGAPSVIPSSIPSTTPSSNPSAGPTINPTAAPTRPFIPNGFTFRMKMHWERQYFWQEEDIERQYCFECTTCSTLTSSPAGEGCSDSDRNDGTDCKNKDQLWIQTCNGFNGRRGNAEFELIRGQEADQIKIRNKDLCLERASKLYINLQRCDANEVRQLWVGFELDKPFDLRPLQQNWRPQNYGDPVEKQRCVTQHHHPKNSEVLFLEECRLGYLWDTVLWDAI